VSPEKGRAWKDGVSFLRKKRNHSDPFKMMRAVEKVRRLEMQASEGIQGKCPVKRLVELHHQRRSHAECCAMKEAPEMISFIQPPIVLIIHSQHCTFFTHLSHRLSSPHVPS
jgi:hypothetical protein